MYWYNICLPEHLTPWSRGQLSVSFEHRVLFLGINVTKNGTIVLLSFHSFWRQQHMDKTVGTSHNICLVRDDQFIPYTASV